MNKHQAYIISADMGYGHQRATYPLLDWAETDIINLNSQPRDKNWWDQQRKMYEFVSSFKTTPIIGGLLFSVMDYMQRIEPFYPPRDLSKPIWQQLFFTKAIERGLGKELFDSLAENPLPIITSFFNTVYMADYYRYPGQVYCLVCDADISRAWAPYDPKKSKVIYLAPNVRTRERLMMYGVKGNNIHVTGFPMPEELVGGVNKDIIRHDLARRLARLDHDGLYRDKYDTLIKKHLAGEPIPSAKDAPVITFAVGGAGAQRSIADDLLFSLKKMLQKKEIKLNLVAGVRRDVADYFEDRVKYYKLHNLDNIKILYHRTKNDYFVDFNETLRETDILWTKPSELSFYAGLGIPMILSEPLGSQENFNREWLIAIGAGIDAHNPRYADNWLPKWLDTGRLARAAMQGFIEAESLGTYNIEKIVFGK